MPKTLTALGVKNAKPGRHSAGEGLYLLVSESGAKSWVLRVQYGKRRRDIGIGSLVLVSLAEARERARDLRKVAKSGRDPIAARDKERIPVMTFEDAAVACHAARSTGWDKRHSDAFLASLKNHVFPQLGRRFVDSVDERDIVRVLTPLWQEKPAASRKLRQRIHVVLDFAKGHGWRSSGAPRDSLRTMLARQARPKNFSAMPYAELPGFVAKLRSRPETIGRLALLFTILTAARSGETRTAEWSHVDLDDALWSRPASLMKTREAHVVTLSDGAISVLKTARRILQDRPSELVFPSPRGKVLSDMTLLEALKTEVEGYTVHGFRSAFRTWAAEQMPSIPDAVAEAALAHVVPDAVVRAYQRAKFMEMRRDLLDAWAKFVLSIS